MKIEVDTDELKEDITDIVEESYLENSNIFRLIEFMEIFDCKLRQVLWNYEMKAMAKENSKTS